MSEESRKSGWGVGKIMLGALALALLLLVHPFHAKAMTAAELATVTGTGWNRLASGKCVYMVSSSVPVTGFKKIKKKWYHFDADGYLSTGWFTENGYRYYAKPTGAMGKNLGRLKGGYKKVDGQYYLFSEKNKAGRYGRVTTGWAKVSGKVYYFTENGTKQTGLAQIGKYLYYFNPKNGKTGGYVRTGWVTIEGNKYYFRKSGKMGGKFGAAYVGTTVKISGTKYTFDAEGHVGKSTASGANAKFIEKVGALAHADMQSTGVLASVTVAQAIVESNYGKSVLATKANNLFGMKAALSGTWNIGWDGKTYSKKTLEYINGSYVTIKAKFRKYTSYAQSIADHSAYLVNSKLANGTMRYAGIVGCRDYTKAARIIKNGGYATAPNYVSALVAVIEKFDLTRFD